MIHTLSFCVAVFIAIFSTSVTAMDYQLSPTQIAENTYVIVGSKEDFTRDNGGNILNTGFIVTEAGVIVIDSGPSYAYGKGLRAAIRHVTDQPILKVLITHQHPDHIFGLQAFADVPAYALPETVQAIREEAENSLDHLYRLVGDAMKHTETVESVQALTHMQETVGSHELLYLSLKGHTQADLVIMDKTTGVVFASDLLFANRAPTTPHADLLAWQSALDELAQLDATHIVPGHGDLLPAAEAIKQTRDYLAWVYTTIYQSVDIGLDMNMTMSIPIPQEFNLLEGAQREFERSVVHLFPSYENAMFERVAHAVQ